MDSRLRKIISSHKNSRDTIFDILVNSQKIIWEREEQILELKQKVNKYEKQNNKPQKSKSSWRGYDLVKNKYWPKVAIGIASYNHSKYLKQCIDSALRQTYRNIEIIIVDDNSSDKKNRKILESYADNEKIKIIYKNENEGISASLNNQIINSKAEWIAFLDCDDFLPKNAISQMVKFIRFNPNKKMIFSNRTEVDKKGNFIRVVDFGQRGSNPDIFDELMKGMASSHLKIINKDVFRSVGLFDSKYDGIQDYDIYLRVATYIPKTIAHINKSLYFHRVHSKQNTVTETKKHRENLKLLKKHAKARKEILDSGCMESITTIILSFNRGHQTKKCVKTVLAASRGLNMDIIIWDNGSTDEDTIKVLESLSKNDKVKLIYSDKNLMCSGGRKAASKLTKGSYLLFLDNDIEVGETAIKELLISIKESKDIAAACCKVVFPDGTVQFNGATYKKDNNYIEFELIDNGKAEKDISTYIKRRDCKWIPGGATLVKKQYFDRYNFDQHFINAYEDNDFYMRVREDGGLLVNTPLATVVHNHVQFDDSTDSGTVQYMKERANHKYLVESWLYFYEKWGLIIKDKNMFRLLGSYYNNEDDHGGKVGDLDNQKLLEQQLKGILNSLSWKITKPLRQANKIFRDLLKIF